MKYIISLLVFLLVGVSSFVSVWNTVSASSIFNNTTNEIPYCKSWDCWVDEWIDAVKGINELAKSTDAATYVTGVVKYLIWFVYLIAVILIIYAWFNILTGVWDEEKAKKSKTMILYVVIWILLIFLAWPIVDFIMNMLNAK